MVRTLVYDGACGVRGISRRTLLHLVGVTLTGGALAALGGWRSSAAGGELPVASLVRSRFVSRVGDTFLAGSDAALVPLQLFKVRDLHSARSNVAQGRLVDPERSFSLLFRGPVGMPLPQETYQFDHGRLGRFDLFIAPMRPEQDARYYEAIFN
jgi:hypothetical protein